jgi:uncharacterized protein with PQ loop repeat
MAHVFSIQTSSSSSSISVSSFTTRKQFFAVFLGSSILISIVLITIILCFVDRLHKKFQKKKSLIKTNNLANGKRIASSSPIKSRFCYEDDSPTHHYTNLKSLQPIVIVASSSSQSSSTSVDSTTRTNIINNRTINSTYSYTAIGTSDELMPVDFDNDDNDDMNSGIELMMTTV